VDGASFNDSKRALKSLFILAPWPRCGHDIAIISLDILAGGTSYFFTQWKDDLKFVSQNSDHFIRLPRKYIIYIRPRKYTDKKMWKLSSYIRNFEIG